MLSQRKKKLTLIVLATGVGATCLPNLRRVLEDVYLFIGMGSLGFSANKRT